MDRASATDNDIAVQRSEKRIWTMPIRLHRLSGVAAAALIGASLIAAPIGALAQQSAPAPAQTPAPAPMQMPMTTPAPAAAAPVVPAPGGVHPAKPAAHKAAQVDRIEARIASLHTQLKLTPDQEPQWQAVAQVMRDNAHKIDALVKERAEKSASMNAVDNLTSYQAIADAHAEELKELVPAFQQLYAVLSDAQKKNADQIFNERPRPRRVAKTTG